ncbi:hypothetical protein Ocin01_07417 [Orchesella cincta]|uniref:Uncharacterized protein n=1 Tax=Orchesella cincta TaxID=48709 RepID=A0A1D2N1U0_ORCCI|nr:hypothetical protein Ocin01_07417 [Orchesella cincta]
MRWFRDEAYLNQTVLAVISDHGARAGSICQTQQGQLEKPMPFADLANLDSISDDEINARESRLMESSLFPRGISLFLSMPPSRTCKLAGV